MTKSNIFDFNVDFLKADGTLVVGRGHRLRVENGSAGAWILTLETLADNVERGARIRIQRFNFQMAHKLQNTHPQRRDYVTMECLSAAEVKIDLSPEAKGVVLAVAEGRLVRGDKIVVRIGDRRGGSVGSEVFWSATTGRMSILLDVDGRTAGKAAPDVFVDITSRREPHRLRLLGPTVVARNEPFSLNLAVYDISRNVIAAFSGAALFDAPAEICGLPMRVEITPENGGIKIFEGVTVSSPGVYRIGVSISEGALKTFSNPIVCEEAPKERIFWGDLHAHAWGDCTMLLLHDRNWKNDPEARHDQARRIGRFDYAAPGSMAMPDTPERNEIWRAYEEAYDKNNAPGAYVPFLAMEMHPGAAGDRTLIFKGKAEIPVSLWTPVGKVYELYGSRDDALLETHIGGAAPYYDEYRPEKERLVEVVSAFGNAEWLLQKTLREGYRPAITGASDLHVGLFGAPRAVEPFRGRFGYQNGLLRVRDSGFGSGPVGALIAGECAREALWKSLRERRGYATTGDRIYVKLDVGARAMGDIIDPPEQFDVRLVVHAQDIIERIDLIVGESLAAGYFPRQMDVALDVKFDRRLTPKGNWFYFRIKQADSEYAWTGPVWFASDRGWGDSAQSFPAWNHCEKPKIAHSAEMDKHLRNLEQYLTAEDDRAGFDEIEPVGIAEESMGLCAKFVSKIKPTRHPVTIRWFFEFEIPRIRVDWGYENFGVCDCQKGPG